MKALVTGISGFAGSHLAEYLLRQNVEVIGTVRGTSRLDSLRPLLPDIQLAECELCDSRAVDALIGRTKPDLIFHLAGQSHVRASWLSPADTLHNNIASQSHLLEAVRRHGLGCRIHLACSSEEYGQVKPEEVPVKETHPLCPQNPYAVSKMAQEYMGVLYHKHWGIPVIATRSFNHTGPGQREDFAASGFAKQISLIEKGLHPPVIRVGNLKARRDFTDVRDMVRAYWLALDKGEPGEVYNVASGAARPIGELLQILLSLSPVPIAVEEDPQRMRPADVEIIAGDASKFRRATGWVPAIPLERTMEDLLNDWRGKV